MLHIKISLLLDFIYYSSVPNRSAGTYAEFRLRRWRHGMFFDWLCKTEVLLTAKWKCWPNKSVAVQNSKKTISMLLPNKHVGRQTHTWHGLWFKIIVENTAFGRQKLTKKTNFSHCQHAVKIIHGKKNIYGYTWAMQRANTLETQHIQGGIDIFPFFPSFPFISVLIFVEKQWPCCCQIRVSLGTFSKKIKNMSPCSFGSQE